MQQRVGAAAAVQLAGGRNVGQRVAHQADVMAGKQRLLQMELVDGVGLILLRHLQWRGRGEGTSVMYSVGLGGCNLWEMF